MVLCNFLQHNDSISEGYVQRITAKRALFPVFFPDSREKYRESRYFNRVLSNQVPDSIGVCPDIRIKTSDRIREFNLTEQRSLFRVTEP